MPRRTRKWSPRQPAFELQVKSRRHPFATILVEDPQVKPAGSAGLLCRTRSGQKRGHRQGRTNQTGEESSTRCIFEKLHGHEFAQFQMLVGAQNIMPAVPWKSSLHYPSKSEASGSRSRQLRFVRFKNDRFCNKVCRPADGICVTLVVAFTYPGDLPGIQSFQGT